MKRLLSIIASLGLAGVMWIAWVVLSVWANDSAAQVKEVKWSTETAEVGAPLILNVSLEIPWHRELAGAIPGRAPDSLAFDRTSSRFESGSLHWNGFRDWSVEIVIVPLSIETVQGKVVALPLTGSRRGGRASANVPLPPLTTFFVQDQEGEIDPSLELLTLDEMPETAKPEFASEPEGDFLSVVLIAGGLLLAGAVILWVIRRRSRGPLPWERALHDLALLEKAGGDLEERYTRLADILKRYAGERFEQPAQAATTRDFPELLEKMELSSFELTETGQLCQVLADADEVRFAGRNVDEDYFAETVPAVRNFVESTIPPSR